MPRTCAICRHECRKSIDQRLLRGLPYRSVARQVGTAVSPRRCRRATDSLQRRRSQSVAQASCGLESRRD
jgi:hypothetical protein